MSSKSQARKNSTRPRRPRWLQIVNDDTVKIDVDALPPPELEFHADFATVDSVSGVPTIWFGQLTPARVAMSAVGIAMSTSDVVQMVTSMSEIALRVASASDAPAHYELEQISADNVRKFPAALVFAAVDETRAMIDFYNRELVSAARMERIRRGDWYPSVTGQLRVFMAPGVLSNLLRDLGSIQET